MRYMNYQFFFSTAVEMLINPSKAWETIRAGKPDSKSMNIGLLLPIIVLISISTFGGSAIFVNTKLTFSFSILTAIRCFIDLYFTIFLTSLAINEAAGRMNLQKDFNISFSLIVFSSLPFFICQFISRFFESFLFINIMALFGLNIFWIGAGVMMNAPRNKKIWLMAVAFVAMMLIYFITDSILDKIIDKVYYSLFA